MLQKRQVLLLLTVEVCCQCATLQYCTISVAPRVKEQKHTKHQLIATVTYSHILQYIVGPGAPTLGTRYPGLNVCETRSAEQCDNCMV